MANVSVRFNGPSDYLIIPGDEKVYRRGDELSAPEEVIVNLVKNHRYRFDPMDDKTELPPVPGLRLSPEAGEQLYLERLSEQAAVAKDEADEAAKSGSRSSGGRRGGRNNAKSDGGDNGPNTGDGSTPTG